MEMTDDHLDTLGPSAIGSRFRRFSDRLCADVSALYRREGVDFEPRWYPLVRLLATGDAFAVSDAAARLRTTHASVSQISRAMIEVGLVTRTRDLGDQRRRLLSLSSKGRALVRRLAPLWDDIAAAADEILGAGGVDVLPLVAAAERALGERSLPDRVDAIRRARRLEAVRIVDFTDALAPHFSALNLEWLEREFEVEPPDRALLDDPRGTVIEPGGAILFACEADDVVGTCALLVTDHGVELGKMAVTARAQGLGIGRRLLDAALQRARAMGATRMTLETHTKLRAAVGLYQRMGFVPMTEPPPSPYRRCNLWMERDL